MGRSAAGSRHLKPAIAPLASCHRQQFRLESTRFLSLNKLILDLKSSLGCSKCEPFVPRLIPFGPRSLLVVVVVTCACVAWWMGLWSWKYLGNSQYNQMKNVSSLVFVVPRRRLYSFILPSLCIKMSYQLPKKLY